MEKLVECKRCGGNACYEQPLNESITTWICMGCGFTTSSELVEGSKLVNDAINSSPELYKDLMFLDNNKNVWLPATITLPEKGMVFIDGTDKKTWNWASALAVPITEEDRKTKKYPEEQTFRMDMKNVKHFGQKDFMDAMEAIGFFNVEK